MRTKKQKWGLRCGDNGGLTKKGNSCRNIWDRNGGKQGRCRQHARLSDGQPKDLTVDDLPFDETIRQKWPGIKDARKVAYLEAYRRTGNKSRSRRAAGIGSNQLITRWMANDHLFYEACEEARQESADRLEMVARRLATGYYRKYKFDSMGGVITDPRTGGAYYEQVFDTGMLKMLHKFIRPEDHREQIDIRALGINISDLPDEALQRLSQGEDLFAVISDLLRRLKQLEGGIVQDSEVISTKGQLALPSASLNGDTSS